MSSSRSRVAPVAMPISRNTPSPQPPNNQSTNRSNIQSSNQSSVSTTPYNASLESSPASTMVFKSNQTVNHLDHSNDPTIRPESSLDRDDDQSVNQTINLDEDFELDLDDLDEFAHNEQVQMALQRGVNLSEFSRELAVNLRQAEVDCLIKYVSMEPSLNDLHKSINQCDQTLESMETMLAQFQRSLSQIANQISNLQSVNQTMNQSCQNRKTAELILAQFINQTYINQSMVSSLVDGDINESFMTELNKLHHKISFVLALHDHANGKSPRNQTDDNNQSDNQTINQKRKPLPRAITDLTPSLLRLRLKCIQRIRIFLFDRIHQLQAPKTNIQIKQSILMKFRPLYEFLLWHTDLEGSINQSITRTASLYPDVPVLTVDCAQELRTLYKTIMSHLYQMKFRSYLTSLTGLIDPSTVQSTDLLGVADTWTRTGVTGLFTAKRSAGEMLPSFILGNRLLLLTESTANEMLIPSLAEREALKYSFERLFAASQSLLMDTATSEYDFIVAFFGERIGREGARAGQTEDAAHAERLNGPSLSDEERGRSDLLPASRDKPLFNSVLSSSMSLFATHLDTYLSTCHDVLAVLLIIRLLCQHNLQMQYRRVHALDIVFDRMNTMLWPKFKQLFDAHVQSISKLSHCDIPGANIQNHVTLKGQLPSNNQANNLSTRSPLLPYQRPLFVSVRYAYLVSALYVLNSSYRDDILILNIRRLRGELEKLLVRSAARIAQPKLQLVFFIHQYQVISVIIRQQVTSMKAMLQPKPLIEPAIQSRVTSNASNARSPSPTASQSFLQQPIDNEDVTSWTELAKQQISMFAEEELGEKFRSLIDFVRTTEASIQADLKQQSINQSNNQSSSPSSSPTPSVDLTGLEPVVKQFAKYWRQGIEAIATSVRSHFRVDYAPLIEGLPPYLQGVALPDDCCLLIMQTIFVQLLLYYQRLSKIVKEYARNRPNIVKDLVPANTISVEIRKYTESKDR